MFKDDTAIILIECQNEFCSPDGALYGAVKEVLVENNVIENIRATIEKLRGKCHIIHIPICFSKGYPEIGKNPYGILKGVVDGKAFIKGSKGSEFYNDLAPEENDIIIEGKRTLCAFGSSNIDRVLRANNIKKIALAGFLTNVCVEGTARSAYDQGYEVYILSDCTATTSIEEQQYTVEKIFPLFAKVVTHDEFINMVLEDRETLATVERAYYT
ncbi:MAG: cysteine hydrolase [Cyanobacteriota bacterium]